MNFVVKELQPLLNVSLKFLFKENVCLMNIGANSLNRDVLTTLVNQYQRKTVISIYRAIFSQQRLT